MNEVLQPILTIEKFPVPGLIFPIIYLVSISFKDEPVKYYMKYLSKPPIFSDQSRKEQENPKPENIKDFIETQKTKTLERDQRYVLIYNKWIFGRWW